MPLPLLKSKTLLWILLPAALWGLLYLLRPLTFHPWCAVQPSPCTIQNVNALDRIVFQFHSVFCDFLSNLVQNGVGVLLILLPIVLIKDIQKLLKLEALLLVGAFWNGACLELARAFAQRPRPLVMNDPMGDGSRILQYTSFYSGHTSFVAYAALISALWIHHDAKLKPRYGKWAWMLYPGLVVLTATLRVLGGRHYPTDTVGAFFAGSLIAWITWTQGSQSSEESI